MRRLILLGLAAALALPASAAHRLTVAQLEETLAKATSEHKSDAVIARQLGEIELSERLTASTLNRLAAALPLAPRTALALQLLSDQSAFLDPPAPELPATEPPNPDEQKRMLDAARGYVVETMPQLPNFFATRSTTRFDDKPKMLHPGDWPVRIGMHLEGSSSRTVTFREGKEVTDSPIDASLKSSAQPEAGLYTVGEFGPILSHVFIDLLKGKAEFSHWETLPAGLAAVYRYEIPKEASHYPIHYCCIVNQEFAGRQAIGSHNVGRRPSESNNPAQTVELQPFDATPAYHGTLSIDPATGAILRITIEAELKQGDPIERAATEVEYARVKIGEQAYICPVRSLAVSQEPPAYAPDGGPPRPPAVQINETKFDHYHRLGATMRILADGSAPASSQPDGSQSPAPDQSDAAATSPQPPAPSAPAPPSPQQVPQQSVAEAAPPAMPATPPTPAQPVVPEISMTAASGVPDVPAATGQSRDTGFSLKVTTRRVDVGVVAVDKKGHPVTGLNASDFEIYDNGHKQDVRSFTVAPAAAQQPPPPQAAGAQPDRTFSNRASAQVEVAAPAAAPVPEGGTILLLDETHIAWNDLNYARGEMLKFLSKLPAGERVGLYSMTGIGFRVLVEVTADHAAVSARLKAFLPSAQSINEAQEEERRNRQQFDEVHNVADLNSVNGNHLDAPDAEQPMDPELMTMGSNPARASLIILAHVARHLAAIPGHKSLVWVSSDNVLAEWQDQTAATDKGPREIANFARRAQEAMNEAHAAVYPFDVSQLEAGNVTADTQHANVQLAPAAADNLATAAAAGGGSNPVNTRDTMPGRISAQMSQDLHPIQGPVRDVAAATGGRTIRRSGDLAEALSGIVADGDATYQLSFSPQGQADGQYHAITVKLVDKKGISLRYRTGYLFAKEPESMKDRFRQAVWQPTDVTEIGVNANVTPSGQGWSVKINIAASDLSMEQQGGRWMDKLDIFFIQRDDAGIHAHVDGQTLGLRLKPSTYQNLLPAGIPFQRAVEMQKGMGSLRVLVVDENSGRMGSVTVPANASSTAKPGE